MQTSGVRWYKPAFGVVTVLLSAACAVSCLAAPPEAKARKSQPAKTTTKPVMATPRPAPLRKPVHPSPMWSVAFSPDGTKIAVGSYRYVVIYEGATGAKVSAWKVSPDAIRALTYSTDGKWLAAGSGVPGESGSAVVLDSTSGSVVRQVAGHTDTVEAVAFSGNLLLSAADDEKVRVTDVSAGTNVGVLAEHVGRCLSVAVPTKTTEADGGAIFATGGTDNAVKIWDAKTRRVVVNFDQSQGAVWGLAAFPRPGRFAVAGGDGAVRIFVVRADTDGKSGDGQRTGYQERVFNNAHVGGAYAVATAPNERFFVSGGADGKMVVWNTNGNKMRELTDAKGDIWGVAVSPDSKRVAAASLDGKVRIYDAETGALQLELPGGVPAPVPQPEAARKVSRN